MSGNQLYPDRIQLCEQERNRWFAHVESSTSIDRITESDFWTHVAASIRQDDLIDVIYDDASIYLQLLVLGSGDGWVKVAILSRYKLEAEDEESLQLKKSDFYYKYNGRFSGHSVLRKSDKIVIRDKFENKAAALQFMAQHSKTVSKD